MMSGYRHSTSDRRAEIASLQENCVTNVSKITTGSIGERPSARPYGGVSAGARGAVNVASMTAIAIS